MSNFYKSWIPCPQSLFLDIHHHILCCISHKILQRVTFLLWEKKFLHPRQDWSFFHATELTEFSCHAHPPPPPRCFDGEQTARVLAISQQGFLPADGSSPSHPPLPLPLGSSESKSLDVWKVTHYYITGSAAELVIKRVSGWKMWLQTAKL
jgi:hypothetical protein